ncbi:hypothetical protein MB901379_03183 [Mycobacterium basiliense]|uniref:Uncharacterized protein n=1 Tax=Mycobacterium basiliense TaxID=2094119 RepID=A0A447GGL5_9MYCO|nr:hypothetical protein MB901379_03183 [Mycobacterium basiliense]
MFSRHRRHPSPGHRTPWRTRCRGPCGSHLTSSEQEFAPLLPPGGRPAKPGTPWRLQTGRGGALVDIVAVCADSTWLSDPASARRPSTHRPASTPFRWTHPWMLGCLAAGVRCAAGVWWARSGTRLRTAPSPAPLWRHNARTSAGGRRATTYEGFASDSERQPVVNPGALPLANNAKIGRRHTASVWRPITTANIP